jgi:hypothetical protein
MAGFWDQIKNLLLHTEKSNPLNPAIHEIISLSNEEILKFENWKNTIVCSNFLIWLKKEYSEFLLHQKSSSSISFLNTPPSFGFMIHFSEMGYSYKDSIFIAHLLKEKIQQLPYKNQLSDRRIYNKNESTVEITERHYLKPKKIIIPGEKIDQYFGNITVQLQIRNDQPFQLSLRATTYPDRIYKPGLPFEQFMEKILPLNPFE